jgi:FtsZ-binding cell division protein ZapB
MQFASTITTTMTPATHEKENASSTSKRKANSVSSSATGRRAVVFAPKQPSPPLPDVAASSSSSSSWLEAFRQRRGNILATADNTILQLIQVVKSEKQQQITIRAVVQEETERAETLLLGLGKKADRVQDQIVQDSQTMEKLQASLEELTEKQTKLGQEIDDLEQEAVRLQLENMSLADQAKATASAMTDTEKLQSKRHRRVLYQISWLKRVSGIRWDYAEIEQDSNRLVGIVVRVTRHSLFPRTFFRGQQNMLTSNDYFLPLLLQPLRTRNT